MFTPLQMGTNHMLGQNSYVPLTTNNFEIRVYDIDGSSPTEFSDLLTLSTDSIGEISENEDIITIHYGNGIIKYPSKVTFPEVDWTLNCYCEPNVLEALRAWRKKVFDPDQEKMGLPQDYMKDVYFLRYDGQGNIRDAIRAPGTWIGALSNGDMNQTGGNVVQVKVPLVISKLIYLRKEDLA